MFDKYGDFQVPKLPINLGAIPYITQFAYIAAMRRLCVSYDNEHLSSIEFIKASHDEFHKHFGEYIEY